jgi:hypothetical protein
MKKVLITTFVLAFAGVLHADMASIDGANTVGFSTVPDTGYGNTILTVPYVACLADNGAISLADLVSTNGLISHASNAGDADQLIVMVDDSGLKYYYYWLKTGDGWTPITTTVKHPDGSESPVTPPAADLLDVARGKGFWLKRVAASASAVFVQGEVSASNPSTVIGNGLNLVGYGSAAAMTLNSVNWSDADGGNGLTQNSDRITVVEDDGTLSNYYYFTNPGEGREAYPSGSNWVDSNYAVVTVVIPAGQGFWYLRRDGGNFNFQPDGN